MKKFLLAALVPLVIVVFAPAAHAATLTIDDRNTDAGTRNSPPARMKPTAEIKAVKIWTADGKAHIRFYQQNLRWASTDWINFTVVTSSGTWYYSPLKGLIRPGGKTAACTRGTSAAHNLTTDTVRFTIPVGCFGTGRNSVSVSAEVRVAPTSTVRAWDVTGSYLYKFR